VSLLSIAQAVSDDIGLDVRPVSIVGNPDVDAQRLLRFASRVGSELATRAPWQALRLLRSFTATATETQVGAIPADFLRFSPETLWDETNSFSITGPVSATEYQARKFGLESAGYTGIQRWFTRAGNALMIWPVPDAGVTMSFSYQSNAFCQSAGGTPQSAWTADTDTGRISEELITLGVIFRFLMADGQPFQQAQADYERRLAQEIANDAPAARVLAAGDIFALGSSRFTGEPTSPAGRYW
jgi:hypothetical protein